MTTNIDIASDLNVGGSIITSEIQVNPTGGNPQGLTINGSSSSGSGTQIFFQESGTTYWQLGPNYSTGGSGHDFWLWNPTTGTNILQIQNAANTINFNSSSSYPLTVKCNGALNVSGTSTLTGALSISGAINTDITMTTVSSITQPVGAPASQFEWIMPFQGPNYKKVVVYFTNYVNDSTSSQSITFPTAFTTLGSVTVNSTNGITTSLTNTELTINAPDNSTSYNGIIIVEGY